ncbi:hypothetical protein QUF80_20050 [Desulfococcaceae bacterium HSG8]|nr:hypothetical protein [Desulfococcaceae bacterium HSG8]
MPIRTERGGGIAHLNLPSSRGLTNPRMCGGSDCQSEPSAEGASLIHASRITHHVPHHASR